VLTALGKLVALGVNTAVMAPAVVAAAVVDDRMAYRLCRRWAWFNLQVFGIQVRSRHLTPLDPRRSYVFMSNHASHLDVLAVMEALSDFELRWVAKKELTEIPLFGWALRNAGHIIVDRSNTANAVASLRAAMAQMARGVSVIIFPEGTRATRDESLGAFKKGGFMLALEMDTPIVPVAVRGTRALLPRDSWQIRGGTVEVVVGAPIPTTGRDREQLMAAVAAFMRSELGLPWPAAAASQEIV
jgi:1-acyl-sn-glycerol-3-phosphate acyltransferase